MLRTGFTFIEGSQVVPQIAGEEPLRMSNRLSNRGVQAHGGYKLKIPPQLQKELPWK